MALALVFSVFLATSTTSVADNNINRTLYTNLGSNAQHDRFMSFSNQSNAFQFPLKLLWTNRTINCVDEPPYNNPVFAGGNFYCIGTDASIMSINVSTGRANWITHPDVNVPISGDALWDGLSYTNGYLAVSFNPGFDIFILNATNGKVVYKQYLHDGFALMTSYNGLFYGIYGIDNAGDPDYRVGIFVINPLTQNMKTTNVSFRWFNFFNVPTFCQDGKVLIVYNNMNAMWTYKVSANSEFEFLWQYTWNNTDLINLYNDPVCIESKDGYDKLIIQLNESSWQILDAMTGHILRNYTWYDTRAPMIWPLIHQDKGIMIYDKEWVYGIYAMNISDPDPMNWGDLWAVDIDDLETDEEYDDAIIVGDYVFLCYNANTLRVLDINNGSTIWEWVYGIGQGVWPGLTVIPGLDESNKPMLVLVQQDLRSYVAALQ